MITEASVAAYIKDNFADVQTSENFGYLFFFYSDDQMVPFVTLAASDNEYDRVSNLDRPGVFRVNIGVSRATFQRLFGTGNILLRSMDKTTPMLHVANIKTDVVALYERLRVATEADKARRSTRVVDYE